MKRLATSRRPIVLPFLPRPTAAPYQRGDLATALLPLACTAQTPPRGKNKRININNIVSKFCRIDSTSAPLQADSGARLPDARTPAASRLDVEAIRLPLVQRLVVPLPILVGVPAVGHQVGTADG